MDKTTFSISDLAKEFGITTRALRFYEDKGLIEPRREGVRRIFSARDRARLKLILRGKRLGFTLQEVGELFQLYDSVHGETAQLQRALRIQAEKREKLLRQRRDLEATLAELDHFEGQCRELLARLENDAIERGAGGMGG